MFRAPRSLPAPLRKGAGDDNDDAPVACSRFRARMNPWRPVPLWIPADEEQESRGAMQESEELCADELQAADRELADLVVLRAQVQRELANSHSHLSTISPDSTREYADTPHRDTRWEFHPRHGSHTPVRVGAGRSDERPWAARASRVSERERLLDAQLQASQEVVLRTPLNFGGALSARPGSARLDLNFDDGFEGDDDIEGGTGGDGSVMGGSGYEAGSSRRLTFFSEDLCDKGEQEDRGEGEESEDAVAATTHWTSPYHRRLRPCKLQLHLEEGWRAGRARTFEEEEEEEEEEEAADLLVGEDKRWLDQEQHRLETAEAAAAAEEEEAEAWQDAEEEEEMRRHRGKKQACAWTFAFAVTAPTSDARGRLREALDDADADDCQRPLPRGAGAGVGEREAAAASAPSICSVTGASSPHTRSPQLVYLPLHARLVAVLRHLLRVQWIPGVLFAAMIVLMQVGLVL